MKIGDRKTIYADIFQSGGHWHFNIHRAGEPGAIYASRFKDGHAQRQAAINHATDLMKHYGEGLSQ